VPAARLARSAEQAGLLARRMGFPVAVKVASPDIAHKSDVSGVLLNLNSEPAVQRGFLIVTENARRACPTAEILGVTVQPMLPPGQDVIVGVVQDRQFGALLMFGSGGVEVEGLKDVAFALAPVTAEEAEHLLDGTWAGARLRGFRSLPPADRRAALDAILRLGQLAADFPELAEIEINPLRVMAHGQGAFALDVRARLRRDHTSP
jgi:acetyltransferase